MWPFRDVFSDNDNWFLVPSQAIEANLPSALVVGVFDHSYHLPSDEVFQKLLKKLFYIAKRKYVSNCYDCDNFAISLYNDAHILSAKYVKNVSIICVNYTQDNGINHMINAILDDKLKWRYIEPQQMKEIYLSKTEIDSIKYTIL